jgi:hypothetical protein
MKKYAIALALNHSFNYQQQQQALATHHTSPMPATRLLNFMAAAFAVYTFCFLCRLFS